MGNELWFEMFFMHPENRLILKAIIDLTRSGIECNYKNIQKKVNEGKYYSDKLTEDKIINRVKNIVTEKSKELCISQSLRDGRRNIILCRNIDDLEKELNKYI